MALTLTLVRPEHISYIILGRDSKFGMWIKMVCPALSANSTNELHARPTPLGPFVT